MNRQVSPEDRLQAVCDVLKSQCGFCDWAGYYLVDRNAEKELVLGPFAGEPTEHTRIGFGRGICGQAADTLKVFVVEDVDSEANYLSCSPDVKSEFVAPILWRDTLVGELDLDSHTPKAFSREDEELLVWIAEATAGAVAGAAGFDR